MKIEWALPSVAHSIRFRSIASQTPVGWALFSLFFSFSLWAIFATVDEREYIEWIDHRLTYVCTFPTVDSLWDWDKWDIIQHIPEVASGARVGGDIWHWIESIVVLCFLIPAAPAVLNGVCTFIITNLVCAAAGAARGRVRERPIGNWVNSKGRRFV